MKDGDSYGVLANSPAHGHVLGSALENAPLIREPICDGIGFLRIELNREPNTENAPLISRDAGRVKARIIRTDEELMIATSVARVLNIGSIQET